MSDGQARRSRVLEWDDPMPNLQRGMAMSPLEYLTAMKEGEIGPPPIGQLMNITAVEIEAGRGVFEAEAGEEHYNPLGVVHGGFLATVLDTAMATAVFSSLEAGQMFSTLEMKVNYLRALRADSGPVTCEGEAIHVGKSVATAQASVRNQDGKLVATATCTCMVFRLPGA